MPHSDDIEELDRLIDKAVDTFFVEMPSDEERVDLGLMEPGPPAAADKGTRIACPSGPTNSAACFGTDQFR